MLFERTFQQWYTGEEGDACTTSCHDVNDMVLGLDNEQRERNGV